MPRFTATLVLDVALGLGAAGCSGPAPAPGPVAAPAPGPVAASDPAPPAPGPVAAPDPAPAAGGAAAAAVPCFPDRTEPLEALALYRQLQRHADAWMMPEDERPPAEAFGSCRVDASQLRAADGTLVAELGCGVRVLVPGIRDDLGLALGTGARGQDVLDRKPRPHPRLACWAHGPDQVGCRFARADDADVDSTAYVVAGTLREDALVGEAAVAFFAPRPLVEIDVSVWCH